MIGCIIKIESRWSYYNNKGKHIVNYHSAQNYLIIGDYDSYVILMNCFSRSTRTVSKDSISYIVALPSEYINIDSFNHKMLIDDNRINNLRPFDEESSNQEIARSMKTAKQETDSIDKLVGVSKLKSSWNGGIVG